MSAARNSRAVAAGNCSPATRAKAMAPPARTYPYRKPLLSLDITGWLPERPFETPRSIIRSTDGPCHRENGLNFARREPWLTAIGAIRSPAGSLVRWVRMDCFFALYPRNNSLARRNHFPLTCNPGATPPWYEGARLRRVKGCGARAGRGRG